MQRQFIEATIKIVRFLIGGFILPFIAILVGCTTAPSPITTTTVPPTTPTTAPLTTTTTPPPTTTTTAPPTATTTPPPATSPTPTSSGPYVTILRPEEGSYEIVYNELIVVSVSDFKLVDKIGQANVPGEGHLIYYADILIPTTPGQPALTASGTYAISVDTSYLWTDLLPGQHTLSVQLVNNDNTPLSPPVTASVNMNVNT